MTTPLHHLTDDQVADRLGYVSASGVDRELIDEAARRLRRGSGNATAVDCTSADDIVVTAAGAPRRRS